MIKIFYTAVILILLHSCDDGNYSFKGSVKNIERGKDGYTAIIANKDGKEISATISRTDMGMRYKEINIGDIVTIYGDSSNYGNEISVHATKIDE
ncbi:MAG: OB-fold nucleic acid binding domain-containing protein [Bacteroidota bacterium]